MAPTIEFGASWRRALTIEAGSDVLKRESGSPIFLLSRDDTNSGGTTMSLSPVVGALIVVGIVIVLIALMAVISVMLRKSPHFKKKKQNSSSISSPQMKEKRKPRPSSLSSTDFTNAFTSPRNSWSGPLSTGSAGPLSERRQRALASLPKIRIDPPKSSSDITVALGTSSSDETMSELQVPQQAKVAVRHPRPAVNADPFAHPQDGMLGSAPEPKPYHVLVSHCSVLPSFYTVSSPKRAESVGKHRAQRKRRSADEYDDEELKNPFEDPHGDGDSPPVSPTPVPL